MEVTTATQRLVIVLATASVMEEMAATQRLVIVLATDSVMEVTAATASAVRVEGAAVEIFDAAVFFLESLHAFALHLDFFTLAAFMLAAMPALLVLPAISLLLSLMA
jgi:hypothetical protein